MKNRQEMKFIVRVSSDADFQCLSMDMSNEHRLEHFYGDNVIRTEAYISFQHICMKYSHSFGHIYQNFDYLFIQIYSGLFWNGLQLSIEFSSCFQTDRCMFIDYYCKHYVLDTTGFASVQNYRLL